MLLMYCFAHVLCLTHVAVLQGMCFVLNREGIL